jgi:S1-C subfamily serine protease
MALLASSRTRVIAGAVAAAVLAIGLALKPAAPAPPPPDDTPAPILQEVVQQREADAVFRRMRDAAPAAVRFAARLTPLDLPLDAWSDWQPVAPTRREGDRFGVVTSERSLLADVADLEQGARVRVTLGDGRAFEGQVATRFMTRGLAVVEGVGTAPFERPPAAGQGVAAGTAAFATAPRGDDPIVAPLFIAGVTERELLTTNALDALRGMPVFTLDGDLAGIVAVEDERVRVLTMGAAIAPEPAEPSPPEPRLRMSLAVQPGPEGDAIVVTALDPTGAAARAGLRQGDQLVAIDGEEIARLEEAVERLSAGDAMQLTIRRGTRVRTIRIR